LPTVFRSASSQPESLGPYLRTTGHTGNNDQSAIQISIQSALPAKLPIHGKDSGLYQARFCSWLDLPHPQTISHRLHTYTKLTSLECMRLGHRGFGTVQDISDKCWKKRITDFAFRM